MPVSGCEVSSELTERSTVELHYQLESLVNRVSGI